MNLLEKYIPKYSGHVKSIEYIENEQKIEIVFFDLPEEFNPMLKLTFSGVCDFSEEQLDEPEENYIELVIGLDLWHGGYCLHTDLREINFKANEVVVVAINT